MSGTCLFQNAHLKDRWQLNVVILKPWMSLKNLIIHPES